MVTRAICDDTIGELEKVIGLHGSDLTNHETVDQKLQVLKKEWTGASNKNRPKSQTEVSKFVMMIVFSICLFCLK